MGLGWARLGDNPIATTQQPRGQATTDSLTSASGRLRRLLPTGLGLGVLDLRCAGGHCWRSLVRSLASLA